MGQCALVEQGFEAVRRALSPRLVNRADDPRSLLKNDGNLGFLRDEAALAVVFIGDEDDHSPDGVDTYVRFLRARKGENQPQRMTLYAIAPTASGCSTAGGTGTRSAEAAGRTGGEVFSPAPRITRPSSARWPPRPFRPSPLPAHRAADPGSIAVRVNGSPVTSGWFYDGATNSVVFATAPAPGAKVEVYYRRVCR